MNSPKDVIAGRIKVPRKRPVSACAYLGVTPFVLAMLAEIGRVKLTRPEGGGRPYFAKEDLDAYLATSGSELA